MVKPSRLMRALFGEAQRRDEILLDRIGRAGDHGGVVTEQQTAERGDDGQRDEKAGMSGAPQEPDSKIETRAISLNELCFSTPLACAYSAPRPAVAEA